MNPRLLPSSEEMTHFDAVTIAQGATALELMERAGFCMVEVLLEHFSLTREASITILCGAGNNGGDGLVIARLLRKKGFNIQVITTSEKKFSVENLKEQALFKEDGGKLLQYVGQNAVQNEGITHGELLEILLKSHIIVDALLGVNQREAPRGEVREIISLVRSAKSKNQYIKIFAVDIPTGLCATTGEIFTPHITVDATATVQYVKRGMVQGCAPDICGEVICIDIGITSDKETEFMLFSESLDVHLPQRDKHSHKGTYGSVFVVGGSKEMPGAPILSALAALRSGAGVVTKTSHYESLSEMFSPEIMHCLIPSNHSSLYESDINTLTPYVEKASVVAVGPGLGQGKEIASVVKKIICFASNTNTPLILDADALNALSRFSSDDEIYTHLSGSILTPHPGEMARLLGTTTDKIEKDRYSAARLLASKTKGVVILKGTSTIISSCTEGRVFTLGTPYLATAGSGDVLTGIVASFVAQRISLFNAACTGVYIHAKAAHHALSIKKGPIIASDIISSLPSVIGIHL